jgi:hypothetical protein
MTGEEDAEILKFIYSFKRKMVDRKRTRGKTTSVKDKDLRFGCIDRKTIERAVREQMIQGRLQVSR